MAILCSFFCQIRFLVLDLLKHIASLTFATWITSKQSAAKKKTIFFSYHGHSVEPYETQVCIVCRRNVFSYSHTGNRDKPGKSSLVIC